jgi:hypothetical protein
MVPGMSVSILGTVVRAGSTPVTITIKPPTGAVFSQDVSPDANGLFSIQYKNTTTPGTYRAQAALGGVTTETSFHVGMDDIVRKTIERAQQILQTADALVQEGQRLNMSDSASSGGSIAPVDNQIAQLRAIIAKAKKLWAPSTPGSLTRDISPTFADLLLYVGGQIQTRPDLTQRFAETLNQLQSWDEQADLSVKRVKARSPFLKAATIVNGRAAGDLVAVRYYLVSAAADPENSADTCENVKQAAEIFEYAGSYLSLLGTPLTVGFNLLFQYLGTEADLPTAAPLGEHAVLANKEAQEITEGIQEMQHEYAKAQEIFKNYSAWAEDNPSGTWPGEPIPSPIVTETPAPSRIGLGLTIATIGAHVAATVANGVVDAVCTKWTGDFRGTMHAQAEKGPKLWWEYWIEISGTLTLYVNKHDDPTTKRPLIGEFEGRGTKFTVWEDSVPVLYADSPLVRQGYSISFHKVSATAITNLTGCLSCVFPGHMAAKAIETDEGLTTPLEYVTSGLLSQGVEVGANVKYKPVDGTPTDIGNRLAPGLKTFASLPGLNVFSAAYFRVPVKGEIEPYPGKVSLTVQHAESDWDPKLISAHVRYLIVPIGQPLAIPQVLDFGLPYQPAEFILKRALGDTSDNLTAPFPVPDTDSNGESLKVNTAGPGTSEACTSASCTEYINLNNYNDMGRRPVIGTQTLFGHAEYRLKFKIERH